MAIVWTESLAVGVKSIDEQHQTLFKKADQLFEATKSNNAKENIAEMLNFLDEYTKFHFHDEEIYMQKIHYPEYETQKKAHTDFIARLAKLKKDFQESGGNIVTILNANQMIVDWLMHHISIQDRKIGAFVKNQS